MVIVVEEQKNKMSIVSILTWFVILGILITATYYIFFKEPETVQYIAPANLGQTNQLAKITLDASAIVNNPNFRALKSYVTIPPPGNTGRVNPFLPFEGLTITGELPTASSTASSTEQ